MRGPLFVATTVVIALALLAAWVLLIFATGGDIVECDRGDCGTLGELSESLGWFVPLIALALGALASWLIFRRRPR